MESPTPLDPPIVTVTVAPDSDDSAPGFSSGAAKRAARNATALALSNVVAKGLMFIWQLALARWLGVEGYGVYGTIGALMAVGAAIPDFGTGLMVIRDVANRPQDAGRYLASTLAVQPLLAALGYIGLIGAAFAFGYEWELRALLAFAAVNLLVDALGNMCHNQLLAKERMVIPAVIATGHIILLIVLAAIFLAADTGLWGLYTATLISGLARSGVYWFVLLREGTRPEFPVDWDVTRTLLANGAPLAMTSFLSLAYNHTDKLITTAVIGTEGTGQLTAGFVVVFGVVEILSTTVLVAVFPLMSRTYASGLREMFDFMLEKLSFFNLTLSLPIGIYTTLLAVPLSEWVFGADFTRTADVLRVLIWYTVVTMVFNVFAKALLVQNRQRRLLVIRVTGLAINIVLNLILLPEIGVTGAAVATLIAESITLVFILRAFDLGAAWWSRMISHVWRLGVAGISLAVVILLLRDVHPLLAGVVGAPVYLAVVLFSGAIARDDWDLIYRLAIAMPGGAFISRYWKRELAA